MLIEAIRLRNLRGFGAEGVSVEGLAAGLNVLAAPNEFGKTTIFDALKACLTVPHTHRKPVESFLRDDGAPPWVEVDIGLPSGRYRIEKRFVSDRTASVTDLATARVVALKADADAWVRDVIGAGDEKGAEGPLALLWVGQGLSTEAPDASGEKGERLREVIGQEVSDVVGGERTRRVLRATTERLDAVLTPGLRNPKKQGALGRAREAVRRLEAEIARFEAAAAETIDLRFRVGEAEDRLTALQDSEAAEARRREGQEARRALEAAERRHAELGGLRVEADAARERAERLAEAAGGLAGKHAAAREARDRLKSTAATLDAARARRSAAEATLGEANAAAEEAEAAASLAAERLQDARAAEAAIAARGALDRMRGDLEAARAAEVVLATDEPAPPPDTELLLRLTQAAQTALATARAGRPVLTVTRADQAVVLNDAPLTPGTKAPLSPSARLSVGAGVELTIDSPTGAAAQEEAHAARRALDAALSAAGVESYSHAVRLAEAAREGEGERRRARDLLARIAPGGVSTLAAEVETASSRASSAPTRALPPVAEAETAAAAAAEALRQAHSEARAAQDGLAEAVRLQSEAAAALEGVRGRADAMGEALGDEAEWDAIEAEARREAAAAAEIAAGLADRLAAGMAASPDRRALSDRVEAAQGADQAHADALRAADRDLADLSATLRARYQGDTTAEEDLSRSRAELAAARERAAEEEAEVEALQLLEEVLAEAQAAQLDRFLAPVMAETAPLVDRVLPGARLAMSGDLSLSGLGREGGEDGFARLSGGTREQLAILTRLGFARMMAKRGHPMPVVLDDALVFADDERIERMFEAVREAAGDVQVIALSCRQRAFERLGGTAVTLRALGRGVRE